MLLRHVIPLNNDVEEIYIVKQEHEPQELNRNPLEVGTQLLPTDLFINEDVEIKDEPYNSHIPQVSNSKSIAGESGQGESNGDNYYNEDVKNHGEKKETLEDISKNRLSEEKKHRIPCSTGSLPTNANKMVPLLNFVADMTYTFDAVKNEPTDDSVQLPHELLAVQSIPNSESLSDIIQDHTNEFSAVDSESSEDYKLSDLSKLLLDNHLPVRNNRGERPRKTTMEVRSLRHNEISTGKDEISKENITQCYMCRKDFEQRKKLLRHLRIEHVKDLPFNCTICVSEKITNLNRLNLHHVQHDPTLKRRCLYCSARFSCGQAVSRHMRKLHPVQYDIDAEKSRRFVCRYCSQKFTKKYDLEKHEKKHLSDMSNDTAYLKRELKCYICNDFDGKSREDLNQHLCMHSDWLPYRCGKCDDKLINSTRVLHEHLRQHTEGLAIKCVYCVQRFVSLADCQRHEERVHVQEKQVDELQEAKVQAEIHNTQVVVIGGQKRFQCVLCDRSYTLLSTLRRHQNVHKVEQSFACKHCRKIFTKSSSLMMHEKRNHDTNSPYSCDVCGKRFKETNRLIDHRRAHSGEKPFICEVCGNFFRIRQVLKEHKLSCLGPEATQSCFCGFCAQTFDNLSVALQHVKISHDIDIPDTKCRRCDLIFRDAESLVEHEFRHTLPDIITCKVCNRIFKHHKNLMRHQKMHADQPVPYMCDLCGKTFTQKGSLTIHRRIHTGERPFSCGLCDKGFVDKKEMRRHYTSHFNPQSKLYIPNAHSIAAPPEAGPTGKKYKTYNCKICSRQFTSSSNLAKHVTTHTGEKKYMCEFCDKRFSQGGQLTVHRRIHTGERPFSCDTCGDRFLDGSSFKRHKAHKLCRTFSTTDGMAPSGEDCNLGNLLQPLMDGFHQDMRDLADGSTQQQTGL